MHHRLRLRGHVFFAPACSRRPLELLQELLPDTKGLVACLGLPVFHEGAVYNAAAVACDGRLLGIVAKQHLAGDGIHYEPRWFRRWPAGDVGTIEVAGQEYPIGDLLFECGGVRIGLEICRDAWVADRTGAGWPSAAPTCCSIPAPAISRSPSSRFASGSCSKARGRFA